MRNVTKNCDDNENENLESNENGNEISEDEGEDEEDEEEIYDSTTAKTHMCKLCSKVFVSQLALQNHLWSHLPSPTDDDYMDHRTLVLRTHENNVVTSQTDDFSDVNVLDGSFICPICGKKISTKGNLKVHLETHRPKGKHGCDICGRM